MMLVRVRPQGGFGEFDGILDSVMGDATTAIARGINDGVTAAMPVVRSNIEGVIGSVLPRVRTELTSAITEGLTHGARVAKTELASTTSDLLPALQASVVDGGTKIVSKYKTYIIAGGVFLFVAAATMITLQFETVRLLKGKSRSTGSLGGYRKRGKRERR